MLKYDVQGKAIRIDLEHGLYALGFQGAVGKTYLYRLLKSFTAIDSLKDKVLPMTYISEYTMELYRDTIKKFSGELIFCDRFDLWYDENIKDALIEKSKICVVLIDLKNTKILQRVPATPVKFTLSEMGVEIKNYVYGFRR